MKGNMNNENELEVTLQEISEETLWSVLDLEVNEDQKKYVAPNAVSIAEAHFSPYAWFRAIVAAETTVGFVLLYLDEEEAEYDIWRFMIDKNQQRKGYGSKALQMVMEHVQTLPGAEELSLSYLPGEGDPSPFFAEFGFEDSEEWVDDEKILLLSLTDQRDNVEKT
jgi:diamine N-acetyltransferase